MSLGRGKRAQEPPGEARGDPSRGLGGRHDLLISLGLGMLAGGGGVLLLGALLVMLGR